MKPSDLCELLSDFMDAWPRTTYRAGTLKAYGTHLEDLPEPLLRRALQELARTATFFPSIAEIRAACAERVLELPSPDQAWLEVGRVIARRGYNLALLPGEEKTGPHWPWSGPEVAEAVRTLGYRILCEGENESADRAHFLKLYGEIRGRRLREAQVSEALALPAVATGRALPERTGGAA